MKHVVMYEILAEVPWNSVATVVAPSGDTAGIDADGFAVWRTGARTGQRIPLDVHGPWRVVEKPTPDELIIEAASPFVDDKQYARAIAGYSLIALVEHGYLPVTALP